MKKEMGQGKQTTCYGQEAMMFRDGKEQIGGLHKHGTNQEGNKEICFCMCQNFKIRPDDKHKMMSVWNAPEMGER